MIISRGGGINTLSISVLADQSGTKGLIESGYLPDKSKIGVSVTNSSGGAYDGTTYRNIPYTASGTGAGQSWSGSSITLSMNQGTCYAYYPYSSEVSDITAVPVSTSGQDDYMYAASVTVNAEAKEATLNMNHALSAVRLLLKRGSYAGTGTVTAVSVTSAGVGTSGKLNAKTGGLTEVSGKGLAIGVNTSITLSDVEQSADVIVVPAGTSADLTLSVTIDGKAYTTVISSATILQSKCHKYTLTVNQGELTLSSVKVGNWGYNESGAPTITAGGYTVTLAGDINKLTFNSSVSDGSVTINARPLGNLWVSTGVSATSGATMNKSVADDGSITVNLSNITANTTVTFTGYLVTFAGDNAGMLVASKINEDASAVLHASCALSYYTPNAVSASAGSLTQSVNGTFRTISLSSVASDIALSFTGKSFAGWNCVDDGVYAITSNYEPVTVDEATSSCIGVALVNTATNQNLMIEKYEAANSSYATAASGKSSKSTFCWGGYGTDQSIPNYTSSSDAKTDYSGKANSEVLKTVTTGGSSSTSYATIGAVLNQFISTSSENQGYTDWYIPACGLLYLIYQNNTNINTALSAIGGTQLSASGYWSSSEYSSNYGWCKYLNSENVNFNNKYKDYRLRLVRDLF